MDVDFSPPPSAPHPLLRLFDLTPTTFPWRSPRPTEIDARRALLADRLFFDILLSAASSPSSSYDETLYPPTTPDALDRLLHAIDETSYDSLKKGCLVYYLLKWHLDGREGELVRMRMLPPQFTALVDAYWHLDSGVNIPHAVSILCDSRLNQDYSSNILHALSLAGDDSSRLVLRYVRTATPTLCQPDDIDIYALALAENSLVDAWNYQRTFGEGMETRQRLVEKIVEWCLGTLPPRPKALKALLSLSLTPTELTLLTTYALAPPSSLPQASVPIIHDLIFVYLVQNAQYVDAVKVAAQFAASALSTRPEVRKAVEEREAVMKELRACVPRVVRDAMAAEDVKPRKKPRASLKGGDAMAIDAPAAADPAPEKSAAPPPLTNGHTTAPKDKDTGYASLFPANLVQHQKPPLIIPAPISAPNPAQPARFVPRVEAFRPPVPSPSAQQNGKGPAAQNGKGAAGQLQSSLFGSTSKATQVRNAFYNPPAPANVEWGSFAAAPPKLFGDAGYKPVGVDAIMDDTPEDGPPEDKKREPDEDAAMDTDDDIVLARPPVPAPAAPDATGLEYSLFSAPQQAQSQQPQLPAAHKRGPRKSANPPPPPKKKKEEKQVPPGAFTQTDDDYGLGVEDDEEPQQHQRTSTRTSARRRASSPPSSPPPSAKVKRQPSAPRVSKGKGRAKEKKQPVDLGRSIPGRFDDGDDDDLLEEENEDEEEDEVPALPQVAPTPARAKKGRASVGANKDVGAKDAGEGPVRRSSRLSITPSVDYLDVGRKTPKRKGTKKT